MLKSIGIVGFGGAIGVPVLGVVAVGLGLVGLGAGVGYLVAGKAGCAAVASLIALV